MFLKSITLNGFKSFPEKYEILMTDRITGIVGPNGSGKSNIGDAVRWVLGEQSAKSLRGDKMEDVIFSGTEKRKQKSVCEVKLLFENVSGKVLPDHSEIEISRKLYRSGESEYLINQKQSRLKDILELFRDTGIGKEGYSIVGQGRIDDIINEKSVTRRRVFEEASGIMKFRVRKEEAERKLERTSENLTRISDILFEIENQLEPLKIQSENARKFMVLMEKNRALEVGILLSNVEKFKDREKRLNAELKSIEEETENKKSEITKLDETYLKEKQSIQVLDDEISKLNDELLLRREHTEQKRGELKLYELKYENLQNEQKRLENEIERHLDELNEIDIEFIQNEIDELKKIISDLEKESLELNEQLTNEQKNAGFFDADIDEVQGALLNLMNELSKVNEQIAGLNSKAEALNLRKNENSDMHEKIQDTGKELQKQIKELRDGQEAIAKEMQEKQLDANTLTVNIKELNEQKQQLESEQSRKKQDFNSIIARLNTLKDIEKSNEGYSNGVKELLNQHSKDIISTVAQAIKIDAKYETAIEAVLGGSLQNIIVEDEDRAKKLIESLRKNNWGRATFLPLSSIKISCLSPENKRMLSEDGILGIASELVNCENKTKPAIEFLLARTVIVRDLDAGISLSKKCEFSFRVVTLLGDIINPGGAMSGGSTKKRDISLLSIPRQIKELTNTQDVLEKELAKLDNQIESVQIQIAEANNKKETAIVKLHELQLKNSEIKQQLDFTNKELDQLNARSDEIKLSSSVNEDEIFKCEIELDKLKIKQSALGSMQIEKNMQLSKLERELSGKSSMADELKEQLHKVSLKLTSYNKDLANRIQNSTNLADEKSKIENAVNTKRNELNNILGKYGQTQNLIQKTKNEVETEEDENEQKLLFIKQKSEKKSKLSELIDNKSDFADKLNSELNELIQKHFRSEMNLERNSFEREETFNKLWEEYQLTYTNAQEFKLQIGVMAARAELETVKEEIRELGIINPTAIEEFAKLNERYTDLSVQKEDLIKAREHLLTVIDELLNRMQDTFLNGLNTINGYFKDAFTELFGGGKADLMLIDKENIMESGIDITAQPPGKKLQSISLLSGGEKAMTAIALLFAMQKINPSPVCILDEIDAALDDENLEKYLDYIKRYSGAVQFVLITHRKLSMAACNVLYGVAMEDPGVSKVISVKLN